MIRRYVLKKRNGSLTQRIAMSNVIPFVVGALITLIVIVFVKNQVKNNADHE